MLELTRTPFFDFRNQLPQVHPSLGILVILPVNRRIEALRATIQPVHSCADRSHFVVGSSFVRVSRKCHTQ